MARRCRQKASAAAGGGLCRRRCGGGDEKERCSESAVPSQRDLSHLLEPQLTVAVSGARAGDVLVGTRARAAAARGVRLEVVSGFVRAGARERIHFGEQTVLRAVARHFGLSHARAAQFVADTIEDVAAADCRPGCGKSNSVMGKICSCTCRPPSFCTCPPECTFRVLDGGILEEYAAEVGKASELEACIANRRVVDWRDILGLVGKHCLVLRRSLYSTEQGPTETSSAEGSVDLCCGDREYKHLNLFSGLIVRVPREATTPCTMPQLMGLCHDALRHKGVDFTESQFELCRCVLAPLTLGGLKSAHQKSIRFGARKVDIGCGISVPAELFVALTCILMFGHPGSFSPELQLFTRGCTSALKRTFVVVSEDAWVRDAPLTTLVCAALLCQRKPCWHPHPCLILVTLDTSISAVRSLEVCDWRRLGGTCVSSLLVSTTLAHDLDVAARALRAVRSFEGDMVMQDTIAELAKAGHLPIQSIMEQARPELMPLCHLVDQHAFRGIAHAARGLGHGFPTVFRTLFERVTGVNPRWTSGFSPSQFSDSKIVAAARFAQRIALRFALHEKPEQLLVLPEHGQFHFPLDAGVLAAAIGPINVKVEKRPLTVTLGTRDPSDEVVMRPPSRDAKDLYDVSVEEKLAAVAAARAMPHKINSPFPIGKLARFKQDEWTVDDIPWTTLQQRGLEVEYPLHPAPRPWCGLDDDAAIIEAVGFQGDGLAVGARAAVLNACSLVPQDVVLRAISLVQQQCEKVTMPTPSLDGGQSADQLMAYPGDPDAYRFLLALSRCTPGALRPGQVPTFVVPNLMLLRQVEAWLREGVQQGGPAIEHVRHNNAGRWRHFRVDDSALMPHQRDAVLEMQERDRHGVRGHFLFLDTGYGKTLTSLCYINRFLAETSLDVHSVLWVAPNELVQPTLEQLSRKWNAPAVELPVDGAPTEGAVNVARHDYLRRVVERLAAAAPRMIAVFDECDTCYGPTQRTSAAHRIAQLSGKIICQTATPLRSKSDALAEWLRQIEPFPVSVENWLVAANGIVSKQIDLGIGVQYEEVVAPLSNSVREAHLKGKRDWLSIAKATQEATDDALVTEACKASVDGVLLVADSTVHISRLISMLHARGVAAGAFERRKDSSINVLVVSKRNCRGYNEASRLGALITGVYAGNGADRHQMLGRLKRIGQCRPRINHMTVFMRGTILELLHRRHSCVDTMNITLEQLGDRYGTEVLRQIHDTTELTVTSSANNNGLSGRPEAKQGQVCDRISHPQSLGCVLETTADADKGHVQQRPGHKDHAPVWRLPKRPRTVLHLDD